MNFNIIEGDYDSWRNIKPLFEEDYLENQLTNRELKLKYDLSHRQFKELADEVKEEHNLGSRVEAFISGFPRHYQYKDGLFQIRKRIDGEYVYFGSVPEEAVAVKMVELCKKKLWNVDECKDIIYNWRDYVE